MVSRCNKFTVAAWAMITAGELGLGKLLRRLSILGGWRRGSVLMWALGVNTLGVSI